MGRARLSLVLLLVLLVLNVLLLARYGSGGEFATESAEELTSPAGRPEDLLADARSATVAESVKPGAPGRSRWPILIGLPVVIAYAPGFTGRTRVAPEEEGSERERELSRERVLTCFLFAVLAVIPTVHRASTSNPLGYESYLGDVLASIVSQLGAVPAGDVEVRRALPTQPCCAHLLSGAQRLTPTSLLTLLRLPASMLGIGDEQHARVPSALRPPRGGVRCGGDYSL
jgi:hypothetical protein